MKRTVKGEIIFTQAFGLPGCYATQVGSWLPTPRNTPGERRLKLQHGVSLKPLAFVYILSQLSYLL
jgi:hypothetical protein